MKKFIKVILLIIAFLFVGYQFMLSDYNPMFDDEDFVYLRNAIKESKKEDLQSITTLYTKISKSIKQRSCICEQATSFIGPYRHGRSLTKEIYLLKIEKEFSQTDCLKFVLLNNDYNNKIIGINDAAAFYFNKNVEELSADEQITIVIMLENSSLYNPLRNQVGIKRKLDIYKNILSNENSN